MSGHSVQGLPKAFDISSIFKKANAVGMDCPPRRTMAAFLTGAIIVSGGFALTTADGAGAAPGEGNIFTAIFGAFSARPQPAPASAPAYREVIVETAPIDKPFRHKRKHVADAEKASLGQRRAVCVRLGDGFFFPAGGVSLGAIQTACAELCPDAKTAVYTIPGGSDRIEDAVSTSGSRYVNLPAALRYRTSEDSAATCHNGATRGYSLLRDATLRKGDSVMTAVGIRVFVGARRLPYAKNDFTVLANAELPRAQRAILMGLERAAMPSMRGLKDALLSPSRPGVQPAHVAQSASSAAIPLVGPVASVTN